MPRSLRLLTSAAAAPPPKAAAAAAALESDFVVILLVLLCAVICLVGLLAVARCAWLRRTAPNSPHPSAAAAADTAAATAAANKGLKKKVLQNLPKFTFESAAAPKMTSAECAICLSEFAEGDEVRALPQCRHVFHVTCIDTWLTSHSSCPSCRQVLVVARCHKCGNFPAVPDLAHPKTPPPTSAVATSAAATCSSDASESNNSNCNSSD